MNDPIIIDDQHELSPEQAKEMSDRMKMMAAEMRAATFMYEKDSTVLMDRTEPIRREQPKIGRNDVCPMCNSGKKWKNCCGKN
jgi:preprotein translocase subunit SecA